MIGIHENGELRALNNGYTLGSGGGSGTPIPTADTNAQFDSDAHMNSTDMTTGSGGEVEEFIDELSITGGLLGDYVVEQGTDGDWIYRKWNSGIAECWCKKTATTTSSGNYNFNFACPTFFISTQPIYVTGSAWSSGYTTTVIGYTNTAYSSGAWRIDAWLVNGKASGSCGATFKVIGKWK